ncbi:EAL domain-containing protein [Pseudaeromonas sp. ZJS20]|uniref:putative bifunctional diguanylate cyclase/phosphodiesterase n=1 Tax=Pseudaeromonas aegiceratis TaxID=3153928 RepID=UPI00390C605F
MSHYLLASLLVDALLGSALLLLWRVQPDDRTPLLWGMAQISLGVLSLMYNLQVPEIVAPIRVLVIILALVVGSLLFVQGTLAFVGRELRWRWFWIALVSLTGILLWFDSWSVDVARGSSALLLGASLLWSGYILGRGAHSYRIVGGLLLLRGLLRLVMAYLFVTGKALPEEIYLLAFLFKAACLLGLIYLVLAEAGQRFPNAVRFLSDGIWIHDEQGRILQANPACAKLFGYQDPAVLEGRQVQDFLPFVDKTRLSRLAESLRQDESVFPLTYEFDVQDHNGRYFPLQVKLSPYWQGGQLLALAQLKDISARKRQRELLERAANEDEVTGLASRHALTSRLHAWQQLEPERPFALLFLDVDHFKRVNDTLGHLLGDQLLQVTARRLQQLIPAEAFLARFGGDEFVIRLPVDQGESAEAAGLALGRRISEVFRQPFVLDTQHVVVSLSMGLVCYPDQADDPTMLLRHADTAMYAAKRAGRNQLCLFDQGLERAVQESMMLDGALRQALARKEFSLVYQPILQAETGALIKAEALIRWHSESLGWVSPDRFIPVAEESGLIVPLGRWVLQEACRQLAQWRQAYLSARGLRMSVNVAAWQLADADYVADVQAILAANGLLPEALVLELTERTLIAEDPTIEQNLSALRRLGVRVALDDFGTGYSSLSYLSRIPLDTLKMDRSFIAELETSQRCRDLVLHIIAMGRSLGLQLVAEGVETAAQAETLTGFGCHLFQGYYFSRPLPPAELAERYFQEMSPV